MHFSRFALLASLALLWPAASGWAADPHAALGADAGEEKNLGEIRTRYILQDSRGRVILDQYFAGRFQLIAFGYTSCPSVCPGTLAIMSLVLKNLGPLAEQVQPIFISVDPERDTPEVLGRYVKNFDERILGLTGKPEFIRGAANNFKVEYAKHQDPGAPAGEYTMDHTVGMYLVGPDGSFLTRYGYSLRAEAITARLKARIEAYQAERRAKEMEQGRTANQPVAGRP